jgi:hypothetical protein
VPKYSAEFGMTAKVQPPFAGLFCNVAVKRFFKLLTVSPPLV